MQAFSLQGRAVNARQISITLPNDQNGVTLTFGSAEHWNVRAATIRGGWRHSMGKRILARLRERNPGHKISTDTARLLDLGGVKSSGVSKLMTPLQIERAKRMNPQIEMLGCNDPAFFSGHTYVAHMMSEDPIDRSRNNRYNLQVVRRPLSHSGFTTDDLTDPEKIGEFADANRFRSQLEMLNTRVKSLDSRLAKKPDDTLKKNLETAYSELTKLTGKDFLTPAEVQDYVDQTLKDMRAKGQSTVSEQTIPVGQEVIPIGINMLHSAHMIGASRLGCGLLVDGISHKMFIDPFVGGRAAAGCGGWISTIYTVKRIEFNPTTGVDEWVDDCTLNLVPNHHIEFHDAEHSQLKACYEEWRNCDIAQFDFTYEGLQRIANGNETLGEQQEAITMLTELTDYAFGPNGPVQRVLGQHRPIQTTMAHEFAAFIEGHRDSNHTTVSLNEQRGGLGKTAAYVTPLMLDISLSGHRAAYATFTRALRDSIKDMAPHYNRIIHETLTAKDLTYRPVNIAELQSPTAFISPSKCEAIRARLHNRRIPPEDVADVQEFLDAFDSSERPCEFADLYALTPTLPCGWTELSLALCPQDRGTDDWQTVQQLREKVTDDRTLILLTHAMVIRNNLRHGQLFGDNADAFGVKTLLLDEADKLPAVANAALHVTVSRNEIANLLSEVRTHLDPQARATGERILARGLDQLGDAFVRVNFSCGKDDQPAIQISNVLAGINHAFNELYRIAVTSDLLVADRIRLCRDAVRVIARLRDFQHPILRIAVVRDLTGQSDITLTLEIGGGRRLISQMWRGAQFETITMASALMTNMPPYGSRYDRFCRDIDLDRAKGDHVVERPPLQPVYGNIGSVFVSDRVGALLPTDTTETNLLRQTSLDGLTAQIIAAANRRKAAERMVVLFQSYVAMGEVLRRLPENLQQRVVMRNRRHLSDAIQDFADRPYGIWFGVEWEGINFVHPTTRHTMVNALVITRIPLAPRDEIRVMRLGSAFNNARAAEGVALYEAVHAAYRKLSHGLLLGIRNEYDMIDELWILDPRWPVPSYVYQRQPPQIIRSIAGSLFNHFDRIIEPYVIPRWYKVDGVGEITPIIERRAD